MTPDLKFAKMISMMIGGTIAGFHIIVGLTMVFLLLGITEFATGETLFFPVGTLMLNECFNKLFKKPLFQVVAKWAALLIFQIRYRNPTVFEIAFTFIFALLIVSSAYKKIYKDFCRWAYNMIHLMYKPLLKQTLTPTLLGFMNSFTLVTYSESYTIRFEGNYVRNIRKNNENYRGYFILYPYKDGYPPWYLVMSPSLEYLVQFEEDKTETPEYEWQHVLTTMQRKQDMYAEQYKAYFTLFPEMLKDWKYSPPQVEMILKNLKDVLCKDTATLVVEYLSTK